MANENMGKFLSKRIEVVHKGSPLESRGQMIMENGCNSPNRHREIGEIMLLPLQRPSLRCQLPRQCEWGVKAPAQGSSLRHFLRSIRKPLELTRTLETDDGEKVGNKDTEQWLDVCVHSTLHLLCITVALHP